MKNLYVSPEFKMIAVLTDDVIAASKEEPVIEDIGGKELAIDASFIF